MFKKDFPTRVD